MFSVRYLSSRPAFSVPGLEIRGLGINETMPPCLVRRPSGTGDCLFMLFHDPVWIGPEPVEGRAAQPAGTLMLWPRGAAHFYGNPEIRWRHSWVHCSGKQVGAALAARDVPVNIPIRPQNPARIARTLLDLYEELQSDRPDPLIARNLLVNLMREAARPASAPTRRRPVVSEGLARAREALESRYDEPFNLGRLAKLAGMSTPHFCAEFRGGYGVPPIAFLIQRRMATAMTLVRGTDLPVGEVGRRVGYADPYHFSKLFKQHFGRGPKAERSHTRATKGATNGGK